MNFVIKYCPQLLTASQVSALKGTASQAAEKTQSAVILSEAKNLSLILFLYLNRREILRFAQNDKARHFSRRLVSRAETRREFSGL